MKRRPAFRIALAGWLVIGAGTAFAQSSPLHGKEMQGLHPHSYVRVQGSSLNTPDGAKVALHGINLGGWLVTENWLSGFTDSQDRTGNQPGRSTLESLEARFGVSAAAELIGVWRDHWITARDLDLIRDSGFNLVRVPISYRTLQHADGTWITDASGRIDFSRMDWIVREAAARGIYTIFDLHVWPQQREDYEKIGRPDGQPIRAAMAQLWEVIAAHYRGNGAVLAFDVLNEYPGAWGVQHDLVDAVRRGDPARVVGVGGFTWDEFLRLREAGDFANSIYSVHVYGNAPVSTAAFAARLRPMLRGPVPVYVGEFLAADFAAVTRLMDEAGVHWSSWTYKTVDKGNWGLFNYHSPLTTDIQNDSFATIRAKWSGRLIAWQDRSLPRNYYIKDDRRYAMPARYADAPSAAPTVPRQLAHDAD